MERDNTNQPAPAHAQPIDPVLDGAQPTDARKLQEVLPQIHELSQKAGGVDRLSEIIDSVKSLKK